MGIPGMNTSIRHPPLLLVAPTQAGTGAERGPKAQGDRGHAKREGGAGKLGGITYPSGEFPDPIIVVSIAAEGNPLPHGRTHAEARCPLDRR